MSALYKCSCRRPLFTCRIYRLFLAVAEVCLILGSSWAQEINSYKTIATGDFPNIGIWQIWNGATWNPASVKPGPANDIYIDQTHTLRLTGNEAVKSVFINAQTGAAQKLNLNGFELEVFGSLNAFSGPAPGSPSGAWNSQNWIGNDINSRLIFKGSSRTIIPSGAWSGFSTQSRYSVIFDPGDGVELRVEEPIKALSFTIKSGSVIQKLDTSVLPWDCPTFSFNNEASPYGTGPFGDFVIEPGASLISDCNSDILFRSSSVSALNFIIDNGGVLILEGTAPRIEAANFQLNGKIIFRGGTTPKSYLSSSFADAANPQAVRDVELQGSQNLTLPNQLFLFGSLQKSGTGNFVATSSSLTLLGANDQEIIGFPLVVRDLTLNKSGGIFYPNADLTIQRNLTLSQGRMDLEGNDLLINTGLTGGLSFSGGSWRNIGLFTYRGIPPTLTASNATFPFEDTQNGGIRKVQLLGNSSGGNLSISFTEYEGAEFNAGFDDLDGTKILYRVFSYFQFSNLTASPNPVELRISADLLIVDDEDDLRIVGTGYAIPGTHLPGLDPVQLWARRSLTFADLPGKNFTIGSFRTLTILPLLWLKIEAKPSETGNLIRWKVAQEKNNMLFEVYRSQRGQMEWEKIGLVNSLGNADVAQDYEVLDTSSDRFKEYFYRVRQVDWDGKYSWSEVARVSPGKSPAGRELIIYPNPYSFGKLQLVAPESLDLNESELIVQNAQGKVIHQSSYKSSDLSGWIQRLPPGLYFISLVDRHQLLTGKLIKN
jgi:hypothetical protein